MLHDADLARTTDGEGPVRELALRRARAARRRAPLQPRRRRTLPVPRPRRAHAAARRDASPAFPRHALNLEVKQAEPPIAEQVVRAVRRAGADAARAAGGRGGADPRRSSRALDPGTALGSSTVDVIEFVRAAAEGRLGELRAARSRAADPAGGVRPAARDAASSCSRRTTPRCCSCTCGRSTRPPRCAACSSSAWTASCRTFRARLVAAARLSRSRAQRAASAMPGSARFEPALDQRRAAPASPELPAAISALRRRPASPARSSAEPRSRARSAWSSSASSSRERRRAATPARGANAGSSASGRARRWFQGQTSWHRSQP